MEPQSDTQYVITALGVDTALVFDAVTWLATNVTVLTDPDTDYSRPAHIYLYALPGNDVTIDLSLHAPTEDLNLPLPVIGVTQLAFAGMFQVRWNMLTTQLSGIDHAFISSNVSVLMQVNGTAGADLVVDLPSPRSLVVPGANLFVNNSCVLVRGGHLSITRDHLAAAGLVITTTDASLTLTGTNTSTQMNLFDGAVSLEPPLEPPSPCSWWFVEYVTLYNVPERALTNGHNAFVWNNLLVSTDILSVDATELGTVRSTAVLSAYNATHVHLSDSTPFDELTLTPNTLTAVSADSGGYDVNVQHGAHVTIATSTLVNATIVHIQSHSECYTDEFDTAATLWFWEGDNSTHLSTADECLRIWIGAQGDGILPPTVDIDAALNFLSLNLSLTNTNLNLTEGAARTLTLSSNQLYLDKQSDDISGMTISWTNVMFDSISPMQLWFFDGENTVQFQENTSAPAGTGQKQVQIYLADIASAMIEGPVKSVYYVDQMRVVPAKSTRGSLYLKRDMRQHIGASVHPYYDCSRDGSIRAWALGTCPLVDNNDQFLVVTHLIDSEYTTLQCVVASASAIDDEDRCVIFLFFFFRLCILNYYFFVYNINSNSLLVLHS